MSQIRRDLDHGIRSSDDWYYEREERPRMMPQDGMDQALARDVAAETKRIFEAVMESLERENKPPSVARAQGIVAGLSAAISHILGDSLEKDVEWVEALHVDICETVARKVGVRTIRVNADGSPKEGQDSGR